MKLTTLDTIDHVPFHVLGPGNITIPDTVLREVRELLKSGRKLDAVHLIRTAGRPTLQAALDIANFLD